MEVELYPHRAARAGHPLLGRIAPGGYEAAVLEAFDVVRIGGCRVAMTEKGMRTSDRN